jgi:hypothetical protein
MATTLETLAPIEEPQQVGKSRKGFQIDYTYNTNVPNYIFDPELWHPAKGRKPSVDALL